MGGKGGPCVIIGFLQLAPCVGRFGNISVGFGSWRLVWRFFPESTIMLEVAV